MIHKFEVFVQTNYVGSKATEIIELDLDDDMPPEEVEEYKDEAAFDHICQNMMEWGWNDVPNK